jgi:hypothetical protein
MWQRPVGHRFIISIYGFSRHHLNSPVRHPQATASNWNRRGVSRNSRPRENHSPHLPALIVPGIYLFDLWSSLH